MRALAAIVLWGCQVFGQVTPNSAPAKPTDATKAWDFNLITNGYIVPNDQSYVSPVFSANRKWLHLEARYNYEDLRSGSLWAGYNFSAGKKLVLNVTPMIGGVFGRTTGIAPGCESSLTYRKIELSIANEYVFDTASKSGNFYYSWPQLTYSLADWLRAGIVAERTKAFHTNLDTQRGFLVGVSHKRLEFTAYVFNVGWSDPTVVLELGVSF
ncbi:MAG TPA: hypothetical protein VLA83_20725 [Candidatus Binatia bacterium]|nr:hypothetical protein [Candidatus Binatia bacterium]